MQNEPHARIPYGGGVISRAKQMAVKVAVLLGAAVTLVSAFVLSVTFLVIGLAVVLVFGGYLWWQTRDLRKQFRARMRAQRGDDIIEGEIIEGEVISRDTRHIERR